MKILNALVLFSFLSMGIHGKIEARERSYSELILKGLLGWEAHFKDLSPKSRLYVEDVFRKKGLQSPESIAMFEMHKAGMQDINAAAGKLTLLPEMVILFPLIVDMLEKVALSDEEENDFYILNVRQGRSPYSLKITIKKELLELMVRSVLEHESGHLYHKHYEKFSPLEMLLRGSGISILWYFIYKSHHDLQRMKMLPPIDFCDQIKRFEAQKSYTEAVVLTSIISFFVGIPTLKAIFHGKYPTSIDKEFEADQFVTDDVGQLRALVLFFKIADEILHYIGSYESIVIRWWAWKQGISPEEFYENNRYFCQRYIFSSNIFIPSHPTFHERIEKIKERISVLTGQAVDQISFENQPQYKIEIYRDGSLVTIH